MKRPSCILAGLLLVAGSALVNAAAFNIPRMPPLTSPLVVINKREAAAQPSPYGQATFEQLIDHANPSLGTFSQRFWWSSAYYSGPGAPVIFFTPGEAPADEYTGYLTNLTITGLFAEAVGGAVVMLEHRYWGESSPFDSLTAENLQYLTLQNSIADVNYFAQNVKLPFDCHRTSAPDKAPWVMSGGSYSGALTAWVNAIAPGTFWAYHASSAVVEAIDDFWTYFQPIQEGMQQNCSADVEKVIDYIDNVLTTGSASEIQDLKDMFGLGALEHNDDFASAIENGPWLWQDDEIYTGYTGFWQWCDYVENMFPNTTTASTPRPGPEGVGLTKALQGYATWSKEVMIPGSCANYGYWTGEYDVSCYDTYNASNPFFTDLSVNNTVNRQWNWLLCNQPFMWWQDGAPQSTPSIVSRLVDPQYWIRQCGLFFPGSDYGIAKGATVDGVNAYTGGWSHTDTTRLIWANGQFDPWRDSTVSSDFRPGGPLQSTPQAPVNVIPGGIHCSDLIAKNGAVNPGVQKVIDDEIAVIKGWVEEFPRR